MILHVMEAAALLALFGGTDDQLGDIGDIPTEVKPARLRRGIVQL